MEDSHRNTVLITGASTGIGRALALEAARRGYDLLLMARRSELLDELRQEILQLREDISVRARVSDVTDFSKHMQDVAELCAGISHLDMVIANAGFGQNTGEWKNSWKISKWTMDVNLLGAIATIEAAKDIMLRQGFGHIVGITSVAAYRGLPETSAYSASKAALAVFLESMRADLTANHITVTAVHPGFVVTPMTEKNGPMPFLIQADDAARRIWRLLVKKRARIVIPWQWQVVKWIEQFMPDALFDFLTRKFRARAQEYRKNRG